MTCHRFVNVHRGERRHVKAGQPHIHNDGDFQRVVVVLELLCHFVLVTFVADYFPPLFGVVVAGGHNHADLFRPLRAHGENPMVNLHRYGAGVGYNHRLARQFVLAVFFVVLHNVVAQGDYGLPCAEDGVHLPEFLFALLDSIGFGVRRHDVVLGVD